MMKRFYLSLLAAVALTASAQTKEITILSVNDIHAAIERFPQFAALVDSARQVHPDLLLLSGGDNRTGNPLNDMYPVTSYPMVALMNSVRFDLSAVGNHEFDSKPAGLREVINLANFRHVCANMYPADTLRMHVEPYKMFERNGVRIGILGLIQVNSQGIPDAHPLAVKGITFRPPEEVAREYAWLRERCDVLILLTHNGYEADIQLAKAFPEADVIIGGHSHTAVHGSKIHSGVLVTQAERWLKYVTEVTLKLQDGKVIDKQARLINVTDFPRKDEKVQALVDEFSRNETLTRVVTRADDDFMCKQELGCMMADAQRAAAEADIAVQNNGGVRFESLPKGNITVNDIYRLDPFGNELIVYNLTGEEVKRLLAAICRADDYGPAFVSGIQYKIALGKDNKEVKKVEVKMPDGSKFDEKRTYKVVVNSYVASVSNYEKADEGQNLFVTSADEMIKYLEKQPSVNYRNVVRMTYTGGENIEK